MPKISLLIICVLANLLAILFASVALVLLVASAVGRYLSEQFVSQVAYATTVVMAILLTVGWSTEKTVMLGPTYWVARHIEPAIPFSDFYPLIGPKP